MNLKRYIALALCHLIDAADRVAPALRLRHGSGNLVPTEPDFEQLARDMELHGIAFWDSTTGRRVDPRDVK